MNTDYCTVADAATAEGWPQWQLVEAVEVGILLFPCTLLSFFIWLYVRLSPSWFSSADKSSEGLKLQREALLPALLC